MARELPFFKLWVKDWETNEAVRMLNLPEVGLFVVSLNHAWVNDGLPENPEDVARALKIPFKEFSKHWCRVGKCFYNDGNGRLRNKRQEAERDEAKALSEHGRKGAKARWGKEKSMPEQCPSIERASVGQCHARYDYESVSESVVVKPKKNTKTTPRETVQVYREFVARWKEPTPTGKTFPCSDVDLGCQVWIGLVDAGTITAGNLVEVFDGLERHKASKKWREGFVLSVPAFLGYAKNGTPAAPRWNDQPTPADVEGEY